MPAWFVRSLARGDTHLGAAERRRPASEVVPWCDPDRPFPPMNREPLSVCYFDWQPCPDCLAAASRARRRGPLLAVVR
ncbi:hypothetical protein FHR81_001749 [Actinoalloteichus hoggarensis]|uniref:Uncharacterized protein n=1 Tax=Actinoalloteichus hoggarensis TaxID=1470176 RepID=A0A221W539_9PSEU|nr:hypothetical protein [Actinoalloteichus hoggarensis]ASO20781.1 hypothetical protein AHOG_15775 [Actinoalloteichus hoggarensis]MBB5920711.1 hypothetical protein [Actinoalloteichus hoggarensis]